MLYPVRLKLLPVFALACALPQVARPSAAAPTATAMSITSAGGPVASVASGAVVSLTATVFSGSSAVHPGVVNFCDATASHCTDIHLLGAAQLTAAGTASIRFMPGVGSHSYKAVFAGTTVSAASASAPSSLTVTGFHASTAAIAYSGTPTSLTLTATVGGVGIAPPTGTISFLDASDANAVLATAPLGTGATQPSFVNASTQTAPYEAVSFASADFNDDGKVDLIAPNYSDNNIKLLLGNGDGTFTSGVQPSVDSVQPNYVAIGDFNGDGQPDIVAASAINMSLLLGNGDGTFTAAAPPAKGRFFSAMAVADFNGDGNADVAVTSYNSNFTAHLLTILLGHGDGTFTAVSSPAPLNIYNTAIATGDFNGDGKPDLVLPGVTLTVLLGHGDGTFTTAATPSTGPQPTAVVVADFNGDGNADLGVISSPTSTTNGSVTVLLGHGDGTFTSSFNVNEATYLSAIAAGDFNGDGKPDLAVSDQSTVTVLAGNGDGTFTTSANAIPATTNVALLSSDFNGDGAPDLALLNFPAGTQENSVPIELASTQLATATVTGVSLLAAPAIQAVQASYPGDNSYAASLSASANIDAVAATLLPASLNFPPTYVGGNSGYRQVTFSNTGTATLDVSKYYPPGQQFGIRNQTCGLTLPGGSSCTFDVVFKPVSSGAQMDIVEYYDNASTNFQYVSLQGLGLAAGAVLSPQAGLVFAQTAVGSTAAYQQVTLSNPGNIALNIASIQITNTPDFYSWGIRQQGCGTTLAAGASCTFWIAFRPTHPGSIAAMVTVNDNVGNWQQKVPLTGTGK